MKVLETLKPEEKARNLAPSVELKAYTSPKPKLHEITYMVSVRYSFSPNIDS